MVIKILTGLKRKVDVLKENFNKEIEKIKNNQSELKNMRTKIKNTLQGINSRLQEAKEQISYLGDRGMDGSQDNKTRKE